MERAIRDPNLDVIRIVAIVMVVILHANSGQFAQLGPGWWISNAINSSTRMAVPLFVILSGFLIIPRMEPLQKHLKRILKIVSALLIWSYVYALWIMETGVTFAYQWNRPITTLLDPTILVWIAKYPMMVHLFFLYSLVTLYLFTPILQAAYSAGSKAVNIFYVGLCFVASTLAIINSMTNVSWLWFPDASLFFLYAGYALFGAIVKDYQPSKRGAIACAVLAGIGAIATFTLTALISQTAPNELFDQYGSPTVIFTSCFAFLAFRGLLPKIPEARVNLVRSLSRMAFGVYFVHIIIIIGAFYIVSKLHLEPRVLQVAVIAIVTLIPSVAIVWALQLNRFGRWLAPV